LVSHPSRETGKGTEGREGREGGKGIDIRRDTEIDREREEGRGGERRAGLRHIRLFSRQHRSY